MVALCPALCSGTGTCLCGQGCACYPGWKGADCSQIDCAARTTAVDGFNPSTGGVAPGQVINVFGRSLDCRSDLDCVWRDGHSGAFLVRTPATVVNEYGMTCTVPPGLASSLYHPSRYGDTPSSVLDGPITTRVPPLSRLRLDVANSSLPAPGSPGGAAPIRSAEFALMRCQPPSPSTLASASPQASPMPGSLATQAMYYDFDAYPLLGVPSAWPSPSPSVAQCNNGGICTLGGTCACAPGYAGPNCDEVPDETGGNATSGGTPATGSSYSVYGSDTGCQALHPALAQFHAIVEGDWVGRTGSDTEGLLMAGRDVAIGRYSVGERWLQPPHPRWDVYEASLGRFVPQRADLAVGRQLNYTSGAILSGGNVVTGGNQTYVMQPLASVTAPGRFLVADPAFPFPGGADFDGAVIAMRWLSASLARLPRTGTSIHKFARVMTLTGTRPDVNVFHLSAAALAEVDEVELVLTALPRVPAASRPRGSDLPSVVINILYDDAWTSHGPGNGDPLSPLFSNPAPALNVTLADLGLTGDFTYSDTIASRIIWNAPSASVVHAYRIDIIGTLLAPRAHIDFPTGQTHGQLLARSFEGNGQINLPFYASACDPALVAFMQAAASGAFPAPAYGATGNSSSCAGSCGAAVSGAPPPGTAAMAMDPFGAVDPIVSLTVDPLSRWRSSPSLGAETKRMFETLVASPADALGLYGAPILPDCGPRGYLNPQGTCTCWDPATYKGRECEIVCRDDFCNGRGRCLPDNQEKCECFDPVRWEGDRCERSTCGVNKMLIDGPTPASPKVCVCAPGFAADATGACTVEIPCIYGTVVGEKCQCTPGWSGENCDVPFPERIQCFHGRITESTVDVPVTTGPTAGTVQAVTVYNCSCFEGWMGSTCDVWAGRGSEFCYYGIYQEDLGYCKCDPLWAGPRCDIYTCLHGVAEQVRVAANGTATAPSTEVVAQTVTDETGAIASTAANAGTDTLQCRCLDGWFGADCGTHCRAACNWRGTVCSEGVPETTTTSSGVTATSGSTTACVCDEGFTGASCETSTFGIPTGLSTAPASQQLSSATNVSFSSGTSAAADQATARMLAASGKLLRGKRGALLGRKLQQVTSGVYTITVAQSAGLWRAGKTQIVSGSSAEVSSALSLASPASVVGGGTTHRGEGDEVVSVFPVMVRLRRKASSTAADSGVATTVSVRLPPSIKATIDGTHLYAALASTTASSSGSAATASGCKPGAPATAVVPEGSGGADAQYVRSTGTVVAVVCEAGLYHVQVMQPSLANRALPPPGSETPAPLAPAPAGLAAWAIALIVIGSLLVVGLIAVVIITYVRNNAQAAEDASGNLAAVTPQAGASARGGDDEWASLEMASRGAGAGASGKEWGHGVSAQSGNYVDPQAERRAMRQARKAGPGQKRRSAETAERVVVAAATSENVRASPASEVDVDDSEARASEAGEAPAAQAAAAAAGSQADARPRSSNASRGSASRSSERSKQGTQTPVDAVAAVFEDDEAGLRSDDEE